MEICFWSKLKYLQILFVENWVVFLAACLLRRRIRFRSGELVANQRCMGKVKRFSGGLHGNTARAKLEHFEGVLRGQRVGLEGVLKCKDGCI